MLRDPCFHPGYEAVQNYSAVYASPCVSGRRPRGAPVSFAHRGTGSFAGCQKVLRSIFNFSSCSYSRCSFNGVFQPPLQGQFGVRQPYLAPTRPAADPPMTPAPRPSLLTSSS